MDLFTRFAQKPRRLVVGLLSGTSADAIDCAVCSIEGGAIPPRTGGPDAATTRRVRLEAFRSQPYDPALRSKILAAESLDVRGIAELHAAIGDAFAESCLRALVHAGIPEEAVDAVGSHGQTIYHHSGREPRVTLQLGDGDRIAERTGFLTVSDFRARDVAAGGEGAPLTPYADRVLFAPKDSSTRRAVLNLGGIANITLLGPLRESTIAFDTGPANAPLDRLARLYSEGALSCDFDGAIAARGTVDEELLKRLMAHPFLSRQPPKSTGPEEFGDLLVSELVRAVGRVTPDLFATVTEFVAQSVALGLRQALYVDRQPSAELELVVAGGGARNKSLLDRITAAVAPARVVLSDALGVPTQAREAMAFALLAHDALLGLPTNLPSVTGARRPACLGKISLPPIPGDSA
ncbi:MAG: anhydro-N-acetylmuramic acid kinase [Planctomycetes bacterium]|nr:anhydro-N-acetylmuramic acid kinase [Planctomycetota bacterium]